MSDLDRLEAAISECREMIREAHAATKDLRIAVREAKKELRELTKDEVAGAGSQRGNAAAGRGTRTDERGGHRGNPEGDRRVRSVWGIVAGQGDVLEDGECSTLDQTSRDRCGGTRGPEGG